MYSRNLPGKSWGHEAALQCKHGGKPPLGMMLLRWDVCNHEQEAKAVRMIFEMYAAEKVMAKLDKLNNKSIEHRQAAIRKNSLHDIAERKIRGIYTFNRSEENRRET